MRIKFLQSCVTDHASYTARVEYVLDADLAAGFVSAGLAVPVEEIDVPVEDIEEAVVTEPAEEAVLPGKKGKRK